MTARLYYTDAYLREFEAAVVDTADDGLRVYLDRTAFYPTSGGQPFDTGRLGASEVVDVVDEGERVAHVLAAPLADKSVTGAIDWGRRFDHMQQHTGQHLLSAVLQDLYGCGTVSVHFGRESSTLDLDAATLAQAQVVEAERRANEIAVENRPVEVSFEEAGQAEGLRKASGRAGTLRIVTIQDLDRSACGGTHVRATGEIGPILLRRVERIKRQVRLEFLCGARAVGRARTDLDLLAGIAGPLSASIDELPALLDAQRAELKTSASVRRELEEQVSGYRARELHAAAAVRASGLRVVEVREDGMTVDALRGLARAVAALPRVAFVGAAGDPATLMVAFSEDSGLDAGALLRSAIQPVGGRGGGNARLAQGTVPAEVLGAALHRLVEAVR
jgi:alanyl-tRNA synthetase